MKKLFLIPLIVVLLVSFVLVGCGEKEPTTPAPTTPTPTTPAPTTPAPAKTTTLVFSSHDPKTAHMSEEIFEPYFKMIEERTEGRVKIESHYAGELVSMADNYEAILKGTVDMIHMGLHTQMGKFLTTSATFTMPTWNVKNLRPSRTLMELYNTIPENKREYEGIKPLMFYAMGGSYIGTTKKPIRTLEDNVGMKMIAGGEYGKLQGAALGWSLVSSSPPETYEMWEKGVADGGGVCVAACLISLNWGEVIKYDTLVPMMRAPHVIAMNMNSWNKLQPQDQKILEDMIPEITDLADKVVQLEEKDAFARAPELYGVEFISLSQEEADRWYQIQKTVIDDVITQLEAKGAAARKVFDAYHQLEQKYSAPEYEYN